MSEFNPETFIKVAADSIQQLRRVDVFRLVDTVPDQHRSQLCDYITGNRPDLVQKVAEAKAEIAHEQNAAKLSLITAVYDVIHAGTESFELDDRIGPDLAYLLGAIAKDTEVEYPAGRRIVGLLKDNFPPGHRLWNRVIVM